jgi:hypothetical protein
VNPNRGSCRSRRLSHPGRMPLARFRDDRCRTSRVPTPMRRKSPTPLPPGAQTRRRLQEAADPGRVHWSTRSARKTTRPTPPALRLRRSRSSRQPRTRCSPHAPTLASARKLGPPTGTPSSYSQLRLCPPHPVSLEPNLHSPRRSVPRSLTTRTTPKAEGGWSATTSNARREGQTGESTGAQADLCMPGCTRHNGERTTTDSWSDDRAHTADCAAVFPSVSRRPRGCRMEKAQGSRRGLGSELWSPLWAST